MTDCPLAIDLYCGLGGWTEGLLAEGYRVVGFDIEQHAYGEHRYPAQLVLQDVRTLHGKQFKDAALIMGSSPCQEFSWRAMPWKAAKAAPPPHLGMELFHSQFRIQREACEAAGRHIPMVVENVRGAIPWVGRSRWNYGSYHLWGDVPALMPMSHQVAKVPGFRFDGSGRSFQSAAVEGVKAPGMNWSDPTKRGQDFTRVAGKLAELNDGIKQGGDWFSTPGSISRTTAGNRCPRSHGSKSTKRKEASAMIAKIPLVLSRHIAATYHPSRSAA